VSTTVSAPVWTCSECQAVRTKPEKRMPSGWKRRSADIFCDACWGKRYVLRAITVPVVAPVDMKWEELGGVLREMWAASTQASNWILTELYARDVRRTGKEEKLSPMPKIYLYPELRERFSQLPSQTIATLENTVKAKYRAKRYETIWTAKSSLPVYRYPAIFRAEPRLVAHAEEGSAGRERAPWRETRGFAAEARHALPSPTRGVARRRSGHSRSGRTRPLSAAAMRA